MNPNPPSWISTRIATCPNGLQWSPVSTTTRPVTQTADVAVNSAVERVGPGAARRRDRQREDDRPDRDQDEEPDGEHDRRASGRPPHGPASVDDERPRQDPCGGQERLPGRVGLHRPSLAAATPPGRVSVVGQRPLHLAGGTAAGRDGAPVAGGSFAAIGIERARRQLPAGPLSCVEAGGSDLLELALDRLVAGLGVSPSLGGGLGGPLGGPSSPSGAVPLSRTPSDAADAW